MLLKLVWDPEDVRDGKILPTAFRRQDLSGLLDDHVSVDRKDMAARETMEALSAAQRDAVAGRADIHREVSLIGCLPCGVVRGTRLDGLAGGGELLTVVPKPLKGNDAHCGIVNVSGNRGRAAVDRIRGELAKIASPAVTFDEAYS